MATNYGWTGQILRVNLTNRSISTQSTDPYKRYVGGLGLGFKVIWDEVPLTTDPYAPEAKAVVAVGPLTGSGVPCSGRTTIAFLTAMSKGKSICTAHVGGHFGNALKYAGYDAVIIEGRASSPVYLKIDDNRVTIERADHLWGKLTNETNKTIIEECGHEFTSMAIGPAGENLVNMSIVFTSQSNAGGAGSGALFGSKNLKAIAVHGTGGVRTANPQELMRLNNYMLSELVGSNNNHNIPTTPQSWAEFTAQPANRWRGRPGLRWERALGGPVDTGEQPQGNINRIAYRAFMPFHSFGENVNSQQYMVKNSGCSSCPVRCYGRMNFEPLKAHGENPKFSNVCGGLTFGVGDWYGDGNPPDIAEQGDSRLIMGAVTGKWADELGLWNNYGLLNRSFRWCVQNNVFQRTLPAAEFNAIPWDLMRNKDPKWIPEIMQIIAYKRGELGLRLGEGAFHMVNAWNLGNAFWDDLFINAASYNGYPQHHGPMQTWQSGFLHNVLYNRDNMVHALSSYARSGTPYDIVKRIGDKFFGEGATDPPRHYTPINPAKVTLAKWGFLRKQWHDSATLCDWVWPMTLSPSRSRGYEGDLDLDAKFMTAVTGENWTTADIDFSMERVSQMLRVMTAISFRIHENSSNLRRDHDGLNAHFFDRDPNLRAFQQGTDKMDRADMERAFDMFYERMGWDRTTGIPTRATLTRFGLSDMADALARHGILPS